MIKAKLILIAAAFLVLVTANTYGQGCSDAGVCTINSFKPINADSTEVLNNQFKFGSFFGNADNSISVYGNYLEYNRECNDKFGFDIKLTTIAHNGNGISSFGLSDIFVNATYSTTEKVRITLGTKINLSKANKTYDNRPLPMDYQASLGSFDLIFGIGYIINSIQFVIAFQQPITQNENEFFANAYPINSELRKFQTTNKFHRSGDAIFRISYPLFIAHNFFFTPSILSIYHIKNDKYSDEFNTQREINGSQGLTLNGNIYLDFEITTNNIVQLNVGMPLIVRNSRPDGLTRSFIANLEYKIRF